MVEITISENKNHDPVRFFNNKVRVSVNEGNEKGVWIDEDVLFELLPRAQKKKYLTDRTPKGRKFKVSPKVVTQVIAKGYIPKRFTEVEDNPSEPTPEPM
jgi:hypothetical protein